MNVAMWVLAGGTLGWLAFAYLEPRMIGGLALSVIIGALGAVFGGNVLAPLLGVATDTPNVFHVVSMALALGSAAACLAIGSLLSRRFRV